MRKAPFTKLFILFASVVITASCQSTGQKDKEGEYKIVFKVKGWQDTTAYLGHYYGENTYLKDTAQVDSKGRFAFVGKNLPQGVYILVLNRTKIMDFVVGEDKAFSIETDTTNYVLNTQVEGDLDNQLFFDNIRYNAEMHKKADPYKALLKDTTLSEDQKKDARSQYDTIGSKVLAYQKKIIEQHPKTLTARLLNLGQPISPPSDESIDSSNRFLYYKKHFFDNLNLADDAMLRLPSTDYQKKVYKYLDKWTPIHPDSAMKAVHYMVSMAKSNSETYKYLVWSCMSHYQQSEYMGMDATYVKIYDAYVATGEMDFWMNETTKKSIKELADQLRLAQIGSVASDLMMQDENLQPRRLYDITSKYVAVLFFDHNCGHCRTETPGLVKQYNENNTQLDFEIFAIDLDTTMAKMKAFIKEFKTPWITVNGPRTYYKQHSSTLYQHDTTPFMYVMESKTKKIIARRLPISKLVEFLTNYEKMQKSKI